MPNYSKTGPFNNGVGPGISAAFLNAMETWIAAMADPNIAANGTGQLSMLKLALTTGSTKRIAKGTGSGNATITHNWGEQADIVLPYYNGAFGTAPTQALAVANEGANSFQVIGQTGYSWSVLYIKF